MIPQSAWQDERLKSAAIAGLVVAASVVLFFFDPATSGLYGKCPFHMLTGLHCPGCGTLRASHQLLHMNLAAAIRLNPLTVASMPFLTYAFASRALTGLRGRPLPRIFVPAPWIWALLVVILAFWFLRNFAFYPFSLLAPAS